MKRVNIRNFQEEQNKELLDYLTYNWPDQLRFFCFSANTFTDDGDYGWADYYLDGIAKVGQKNIYRFRFNKYAIYIQLILL